MDNLIIGTVGFFIGVILGLFGVDPFSKKWWAWVVVLSAINVIIVKTLFSIAN